MNIVQQFVYFLSKKFLFFSTEKNIEYSTDKPQSDLVDIHINVDNILNLDLGKKISEEVQKEICSGSFKF